MREFGCKNYLYLDAAVLCDPACLSLVEEMAKRHRPIYLYLHDVWELEEVKTLDAFAYICEVIYGESMEDAVGAYAIQQKQALKQVVLLHGDRTLHPMRMDAICIYDGYKDMEDFLSHRSLLKRKRTRIVYGILLACVVYFIGYVLLLDSFPAFMLDGFVAMLFVMIPSVLAITVIVYGLTRDVIHWSFLLELLDMVS